MNNRWDILVVLMQGFAALLLILCVLEHRKQTASGRLIGTAWLMFAVLFGCVAMSLNIMNTTRHLRNSQKPWRRLLILDGIAVLSGLGGGLALVKAVYAKDGESERTMSQEDAQMHSDIWLPPPRKP